MASPDYDKQLEEWQRFCQYFERGTIGEAGLELQEAFERRRHSEIERWRMLEREFPYAITGVDPGEFLNPTPQLCKLFESFVQSSHQWLAKESALCESDFWEEMTSLGCYWVRFRHQSDLERYRNTFSGELNALDFKERSQGS